MSTPYWIWSDARPTLEKGCCFFRKTFELDTLPAECPVQVSADSIYRLYVNGTLVSRGPQKSDRFRRYYETVDIAPLLRPGKNALAAFVCHFIDDEENSRWFETGPISVKCSLRGGFIVMCDTLDIATDRSWLVMPSDSVQFVSPYRSRYATDMLHVRLCDYPAAFAEVDFDDRMFQRAQIVADTAFEKWAGLTLWPLTPANIPPMEETPIQAARVSRSSLANAGDLLTEGRLVIPPGEASFIELDMGELTTAHIQLFFEYGLDLIVPVRLTYAESYFRLNAEGELYKGVRDDTTGAIFDGETDTLELSIHDGEAIHPLLFETVFYRTFRFLRIDIGNARAPIVLCGLRFTRVWYPLAVSGRCDAPALDSAMWDISVRTLRLCMHQTYEDCPYYEQMQYTMDTALQMKYTYQITTDDRLARNAIDAFSAARMPDGLVPCTSPAKFTQVIPGFSMYFIEMLYDHYYYFGDEALLRRYLCVADSILQYFAAKINPQTGLFDRSDYWEFTDWVQQWHHNFGVPISKKEKIHTIYHQMYVYFLKKAAELNEMIGREGIAGEYRAIAERVSAGVLAHCYDASRGLFTDTVGRSEASVHGQIWAVLSGIVSGADAEALVRRALDDASLFQCSYSMTFYLLRTLEMVGLYGESAQFLKTWEGMMENHMTTWCEDPVTQRSDCHGWSSLPIYEFTNRALGVSPLEPGYRKIRIAPFINGRPMAEGTVASIRGDIHVRWEKRGGGIELTAQTPVGVPVEVVLAGHTWHFAGGDISAFAAEEVR